LNLTFEQWILLLTLLLNTGALGFFALVRTYYQRKGYKLQQTMLKESREYWSSWKERSKDIAFKVKKDVKKEVKTQIKKLEENLENGKKEN